MKVNDHLFRRTAFRGAALAAASLACCASLLLGRTAAAHAPRRLPEVSTAPALPEPIYWKQHLFLVPYQWSSPTEAGAAGAVWLFVSKDRGASWQKISEAQPQVTAFTYRAEADGEYWFAVRTIDQHGRAWPAGDYQPELRVVVDTMMPQFSAFAAHCLPDGNIEIEWRAADANLDTTSIQLEAQNDAGAWQSVPAESLIAAPNTQAVLAAHAGHTGRLLWQGVTATQSITAVRATLLDRAGNRATYQAPITGAPADNLASVTAPPSTSAATNVPITPAPPAGWTSGSAASPQPTSAPASQPWAPITSRAPFRLFHGEARVPDDGVTAYGSVPAVEPLQLATNPANQDQAQQLEPRYAGPLTNAPAQPPSFAPLEPFRQASLGRSSTNNDVLLSVPPNNHAATNIKPPVPPKQVGSRTFALEYDLDDVGRGPTKVELWGTRDGGQTWRKYAHDDDLRSPIVTTVDEEGLYGFRIMVEAAGLPAAPPASGEEPELWVAVDLRRPMIELTSLQRGDGNQSDHLFLRWRAVDDNLQPRPISLFYSSRPSGPWSAIATHLENTGQYAWRVERHVPGRFYLRLEAQDAAGNLAAFQTREPVEFAPSDSSGTLRDAESWGPTATGSDAAYR